MPPTDLQSFIDAAKAQGASDEFLAALLIRQGWPPADVYRSLGHWWERTTGVALPVRRAGGENARDAFLYLLSFATLATWAGALGSLLFRLTERWIPDPVAREHFYNFRATVTWQIASILVALPVYLVVMRMILRDTAAHKERVESGVRKWLTYIALLLTAGAVIGDLVWFVNYFLSGELTVRFVLKCAVVLAICGSIFWFYLGFLRGKSNGRAFAIPAVGCAAAAIALGLMAAGTPRTQRAIEADNRRVQDLRAIAMAIAARERTPQTLDDLRQQHPGLRLRDPETERPYEYLPRTADTYELCGTFAAESESPDYAVNEFWSHPAGRTCFTLDRRKAISY